jgi:hypothetical protein
MLTSRLRPPQTSRLTVLALLAGPWQQRAAQWRKSFKI